MSSAVKTVCSATPDQTTQAKLIAGAKALNVAIKRLIISSKQENSDMLENFQNVSSAIATVIAASRGFDSR
jgi:hypothetical protein